MKKALNWLLPLICLAVSSFAVAETTMNVKTGSISMPVIDCCYEDNIIIGNQEISVYDLSYASKGVATVRWSQTWQDEDTTGYDPLVQNSRGAGADTNVFDNHTYVNETCTVVGKIVGISYATTDWNVTADTATLSNGIWTQTGSFTCRYNL